MLIIIKANKYAIVEKFNRKNDSQDHTVDMSFDYIPAMINDTYTELRNFIAHGLKDQDRKVNYIRIDNLIIARDCGKVINNNIKAGMDEASIAKGIRDMLNKKILRKPK